MCPDRVRSVLFAAGDHAAGALTGAATAAAVRAVVSPDQDMVLAMVVGMMLGMVIHLTIGAVLSPLVGFFHLMVPGSLIGMYGGMLFAMRDTMQHRPGSLGAALVVGAVFGVIVVASVQVYDRAIRPAPDAAA
jgi:hypothetical protein